MKWFEDESLEDLWAGEDIYDDYDVSKELNIIMINSNVDDEVEKLKYDSLRIRKIIQRRILIFIDFEMHISMR